VGSSISVWSTSINIFVPVQVKVFVSLKSYLTAITLFAIGVAVALVAGIIAVHFVIVISQLVQLKSNSVFTSTSSNNTPPSQSLNHNSYAEKS
jgi:hypothetical protein